MNFTTKYKNKKKTSETSWPLSMVNMIVLRSTPMKFTSIPPVFTTLVHFMAISDTTS